LTGDTECKPDGDMLGGVYGIDRYYAICLSLVYVLKAVETVLLRG